MSGDLSGKICLVTGATQGIGKETARGLARLGAHVVVVGRNAARTQATVEWIQRETGNQRIDSLLADLSSMAEVRRLAREFEQRYDRLDVLINNAGGIFSWREITVDGFERTWALNHLSYFLLTLELLKFLQVPSTARIVNVASAAHISGKIEFDDLQSKKQYAGLRSYSRSKLANVLFTYALIRRLEGTGVTANVLHPGVIASGIGSNSHGLLKVGMVLAKPFLTRARKGAATSIYLASSSEVEGVTGKYFARRRAIPSSLESYDEALQERLWSVSLQQVGLDAAASRLLK